MLGATGGIGGETATEREEELGDFVRFHFQSHWDADGTTMLKAIREAVGKPSLPIKPIPWFMFRVGGFFNETMREIHNTRPLRKTTIELYNMRLVSFLGKEPHTPWNEAVTTTLIGLGYLPRETKPSTASHATAPA